MNYEESIKYLRRNSHSAYEIHKATGLTEAGVRKVMKGVVAKPQRKTKEALIEYTQNILESESDTNFITDELTLNQINLDQHLLGDLKLGSEKFNIDIKKTRRNLNLSQTAFGKLFGVGIRTVQLWESGDRLMTNSVKIILDNYLKDEHRADLTSGLTSEERIQMQDLASDVIKNHEKLLLNSNYKNWFELQVYKKALEVMSK